MHVYRQFGLLWPLATNVAAGFAAYILAIPWIFAAAALAEWVGRHYFRDLSPP